MHLASLQCYHFKEAFSYLYCPFQCNVCFLYLMFLNFYVYFLIIYYLFLPLGYEVNKAIISSACHNDGHIANT